LKTNYNAKFSPLLPVVCLHDANEFKEKNYNTNAWHMLMTQCDIIISLSNI